MVRLPHSDLSAAYIVDLLAIVQMITKGNMTSFGELSDQLAHIVLTKFKFANAVQVVPDRYDYEDSIKAGERIRRSKWRPIEIRIQNRETKLPSSLKRYLSSGKNKCNLVSFLLSDWKENIPQHLTDEQTLTL